MDIYSLDIPNIRTRKIGSGRDRIEMVEAVIRLEAWDGYLVKRWEYPTTIWEKARWIEDGTIVLHFACTSVSSAEDWETQVAAYRRLVEEQFAIRDSIVKHLRENFDTLKETYYLDPDDDPDVPRITDANKQRLRSKALHRPAKREHSRRRERRHPVSRMVSQLQVGMKSTASRSSHTAAASSTSTAARPISIRSLPITAPSKPN